VTKTVLSAKSRIATGSLLLDRLRFADPARISSVAGAAEAGIAVESRVSPMRAAAPLRTTAVRPDYRADGYGCKSGVTGQRVTASGPPERREVHCRR
jgi:hypothetical protein